MRFTSTTKKFLLFLLGISLLSVLVIYIIQYQPQVGKIIGYVLMGAFCCFMIYVVVAPILRGLNERADSIITIYKDVSGQGLHIFSSFCTSGGSLIGASTRSIQYYFLNSAGEKLFYKVVYHHSMEPADGRSGYVGFYSLEESVLQGEVFKKTLQQYSNKVGRPLQLGEEIAADEDGNYTVTINNHTYKTGTVTGFTDDTLFLRCYDTAGNILWKKKL